MIRSFPTLRRLDPQDYARRQVVERWQQAGYPVDLHRPPPAGGYLEFCAQGRGGDWQGLVDAREWLDGLLPALQALLKVPCAIARIAELFQALARPLEVELDGLGYERLSSVAVSNASALAQPLPRIATPRGSLWLLRLPESRPPPLSCSPWLLSLPQSLRLTLGYSRILPVALHPLARGDVLRISRLTRQWQLAGQPVGEFTFTEQGLQMTLSPPSSDTPHVEPVAALGSLPVHLEFVLHEQRISLAELAALIEGQVLTLDSSVLRAIEIRANGRTLARGELVQLGENLGVELQQIFREQPDEQ
ncbi:type III secretion protein Q [Pseudomonas asplenii]|uniref:Surface presentation of antigens protein SpaO n=1 Tax=Pseudomonas asplenii TaxID=53407 RepID=A0A1H2ACR2_9PSED|nr:FliM/FliN family flagellar motor switch protein [Pseudomonas asplenii]SDT43684.1 type III secretion protein Q [Pseudomonas asplenii]